MKKTPATTASPKPGFARIPALLAGSALLALLAAPATLHAAQASVAWNGVTAAPGATILGYKVHYGRSSGTYEGTVDVGLATATTLTNLQDGEAYYIAVSAYDQFGQDGALSAEAVFDGAAGLDADGDGIPDLVERGWCTSDLDADSDDDGIPDGVEDANRNGIFDPGETDPCVVDTDGDGLQDGTELGYAASVVGAETAGTTFQPDLDPSTVTDPLNPDTDGDGLADGVEDANHNGALDPGETDPLVPDATLLFSETFDDGGPAGDPDWTPVSGIWSVTSKGAFVSASPFNNLALVSDPGLQQQGAGRIEARLRLPKRAPKGPNAAVLFQYQDERTYRYVRIAKGRIVLGQVGDFPGAAAGVLKSRKVRKLRTNRWYRLRVDVDEAGTVAVYFNGNARPALTASFPSTEPGALGLWARKSASRFDDMSVWSRLVIP